MSSTNPFFIMTTKTNKNMRINQKRDVQDLKEGRYPKVGRGNSNGRNVPRKEVIL